MFQQAEVIPLPPPPHPHTPALAGKMNTSQQVKDKLL